MKFEHILQIYWTKGFFFGGNLFYINQTLESFFLNTPGLSIKTKIILKERFELSLFMKKATLLFIEYEIKVSKFLIKPLNIFLSQINTVNNTYKDLIRLNIIRLFLIKSYKGYGHALGKPIHGQRTWSNAWTSYKYNKVLRFFLNEMLRKDKSVLSTKKKNYKILKKKYPKIKNNTNKFLLQKNYKKWF